MSWRKSKYLGFAWAGLSASGKTEIWRVTSMSSGDLLGGVCWYGPWRQYVFEPEDGTVFNNGCLNDISDFLSEMNAARRSYKPVAEARQQPPTEDS